MLDIRYVRENPERVKEFSKQKGYDVDVDRVLTLDEQRRELQQQIEVLRTERNSIADAMKQSGGKPDQTQIDRGRELKVEIAEIEEKFNGIDDEFLSLFKKIPNIPADDVPIGATEDENVVAKKVGEPAQYGFTPKSHAEIAETKGWLDKEHAAKVTGSRFAYLKGDLVKLQFALIQFVMDKLSDQAFIDEVIAENNLTVSNKPFLPVLPPFMLRTELYDAMDRLEPRDDRYKIEDEDLWLQGSAEHVLGSMHADEIFNDSELPVRYIGYATSFRREAGTYGKDMEGMFRMHQFDKLEMESLTAGDDGLQEHLLLVAIQEKIMSLLEIPYQVLQKCTADIGKPNARGIDIEAWLPGQSAYRETHTADYMTDYQARRLKTRVRRAGGDIELIHTNDATALPLSRGPIAIIENHQTSEGDVIIPTILRSYMGGKERI
ncbi:TPA: serine--tRNA ligase [Candidatus Saccharibacteria bacterium]|nr:MAG: seryl-tRNA synthetase [Candidatus Saccharibacteria bacterium GW2011_GWC2_44_17]OGL34128.1 MAG: serine--tRNA ligase [Candidatus Saccharibacteria bacterium RIFCSPHIGHO2_12_FULL_47_16]HBH78066.1 serine--tRNA ligase [Candidatus Saccharibacteria bacterium]